MDGNTQIGLMLLVTIMAVSYIVAIIIVVLMVKESNKTKRINNHNESVL